MLSSREIVDIIAAPPTAMNMGKVRFLADREKKRSFSSSTRAQRAFIEAAQRTPVADPVGTYRHPAAQPLPMRDNVPLSPVELAWLQRLPADPTQVSFDDAQALAAMDKAINPLQHPADSRLVRSVWAPVRDMHDANANEVQIRAARRPLPPMPHETLSALADAFLHENSQLNPQEALTRANAAIQDAAARRQGNRDAGIVAAQDGQAALVAAAKDRTTVTR